VRSPHVNGPHAPDDDRHDRAVPGGAHRLWAGPLESLRQQRGRVSPGASPGPSDSDVTEGSGGIWERLHYDWSDRARVVIKTTDSNVWSGNSGHVYTFTRRPDGRTDIDAVVVREGKNLKGRALGFVLGTIGKRVLEKAFDNTVRSIEAGTRQEVGEIVQERTRLFWSRRTFKLLR